MDQPEATQIRTYDPASCVVFRRTREKWGGLSNMAAGYPLMVNDVPIRTSEALYQACRYPHRPDLQRQIIAERSPMTAKMRGKPYRKKSRPHWEKLGGFDRTLESIKIMRWCLRVKLAQNWSSFGNLLLSTGGKDIVEHSRRDDFWGAKETEEGLLIGLNVLGRLLKELREEIKVEDHENFKQVEPLAIPNFFLYGMPIGKVYSDVHFQDELAKKKLASKKATARDGQLEFWQRMT